MKTGQGLRDVCVTGIYTSIGHAGYLYHNRLVELYLMFIDLLETRFRTLQSNEEPKKNAKMTFETTSPSLGASLRD